MEATVEIRYGDNQVYLPVPAQFLKNLSIQPGDRISLHLEGDTITILPNQEPAVELASVLAACSSAVLERDLGNRKWCYMSLQGRER